jgi:hypothetical protein
MSIEVRYSRGSKVPDLAECDAHPRAAEFRRYLEWKRELIAAS